MRRRRIGILIKDVEGFYHQVLWKGFAKEAEEIGADLICVAGGSPKSPRVSDAVSANRLYGLPGLKRLDGLIVVGTSVCQHLNGPERRAFLDQFGIPLVHVGLPIEGHPSVTINPENGIIQAVRHTVEDHGFERFGIISGVEYDLESIQRVALIERTLSEYGLKVRPGNVVPGWFTIESGRLAVRNLCDGGRPRVECIFCGNDQMAIGALYTLKEMGVSVPNDVALLGFDNVEHLNGLNPPLTTIRQPLREQAERAVRLLEDIMDGRGAADALLDTELLIRESCGCSAAAAPSSQDGPKDYISRIARSDPPISAEALEKNLSGIGDDDGEGFIAFVKDAMRSTDREESILAWRAVFEDTASGKGPAEDPAVSDRARLETVLSKASHLATRRLLSLEVEDFWDIMDVDWRQKHADLENIMNSRRREELFEHLERSCRATGVKFLRVVLFEDGAEKNGQKLVCSYPDANTSDGRVNCLNDVLPHSGEGFSGNVLVKLLNFQNEVFGYIMLDIGAYRWLWYENLRAGISGALNRIAQIRRLEQAQEELRASYMVLEQTQRDLHRAEYTASLGQLIRGLAHEINGPVGGSLTAMTHVRDTLAGGASEDTRKLIDIAVANMEITGTIIRRLKGIVGEDMRAGEGPFGLHQAIEDAFLSSHYCTSGACPFTITGTDGDVENGDSHDLEAILSELIANSVLHGRHGDEPMPSISVETEMDDGLLVIVYEDDGRGVTGAEIDNLTVPFYTTTRGRGDKGLGLAVVRSLVEIRNNGSLALEQTAGGGLRVVMSLPWKLRAGDSAK